MNMHTHTHTHPFNGPFSRTTRVSRYQKGKTNPDFAEIYLLGSVIESLSGSKLPSNGDVLRLYVHKLKSAQTKHDAAVTVIKKVQLFREKARIPVRHTDHATAQLEELVHKWERLKKNKGRTTATQVANEAALTDTFNDLFDVAHQDALQIVKIEEDKQFLLAQREKGRRGVMTGVDVSQTKEEEHMTKQQRQLRLKEKQQTEIEALDRNISLMYDSSSSTDDVTDSEPEETVAEINQSTTLYRETETQKNQHPDTYSTFFSGQGE